MIQQFKLRDDQIASYCLFSPDGAYLFLQVVSPKEPAKIIRVNMSTGVFDDFHHSAESVVEDKFLSLPVKKTFKVPAGEGSEIDEAYGYYYPPKVITF